MATTTLYTPWNLDSFDPSIAGVAPIVKKGTAVDNTQVAAVQAAALAALGYMLATTAGGVPATVPAAAVVPAWAPNIQVAASQAMLSPTGVVIVRLTAGVTRSSFDATEAALWTTEGSGAYVAKTAVTYLPVPSGDVTGATDTAAINTVLAQGGRIRPHPDALAGTYYLQQSAIYGPSGTLGNRIAVSLVLATSSLSSPVDVDFGLCRFVLTSQCPPLSNAARVPSNVATDVSAVAASSVITSAALVAAGAAIGHQVGVPGAGAIGGDAQAAPMWLYGTITAVSGNNITLGGNANGVAAHATIVSGGTGYLFKVRDAALTVRGGIWDAGTVWNGGTAPGDRWRAANNSSVLPMRRVDGLTVRDATFKQTSFPQAGGWCYGVDPGDCTDVLIDACTGAGSSTVVNGTGPLKRITVRNTRGQTQDDMTALGTVGASYTDTEGDIDSVLIDGVMSNGSWRCADLYAGQGANSAVRPFTNGKVRSCKGAALADAVQITNYNGNATMSVDVDDITASFGSFGTGGPYYQVKVPSGQAGIVVTGPYRPGTELASANVTGNVTATTAGAAVATLPAIIVPPSGAVVVEVNCYGFQQLTSSGVPNLSITDGANTVTYDKIDGGTCAASALTPSLTRRAKLTGLTPGASMVFKLWAFTSVNTATMFAAANFPTQFRVLAA